MTEVGKSTEPERELFGSLLLYGGLAVTGLLLSQFAFTSRVREQILKRDGYKCVEEGNGECIGGLEASHLDHNRDNKWYNDPENGITLCTKHHYYQHIREEGRNGLIKKHNQYAIQKLKERLLGYINFDNLNF
mgnify:CR=1 FL=1